MQLCLSHTFLTCSVYSVKSDCGRECAAFVSMLLCSLKKPSEDQQSSVKTSCSATPTLLLRLFQLPHLHENVYLPHSSCNATSVWTILGRCTHFLVSSLWLLIPTPTATFQLGQHKYLWSCAENRIGELIKLKITFFFS